MHRVQLLIEKSEPLHGLSWCQFTHSVVKTAVFGLGFLRISASVADLWSKR